MYSADNTSMAGAINHDPAAFGDRVSVTIIRHHGGFLLNRMKIQTVNILKITAAKTLMSIKKNGFV